MQWECRSLAREFFVVFYFAFIEIILEYCALRDLDCDFEKSGWFENTDIWNFHIFHFINWQHFSPL